MTMRLGTLLASALAQSSSQLEGTAGEVLRAPDILSLAEGIAVILRELGVDKNEPVVLVVSNEPKDVVSFLGVWLAGGVAIPIHASSPQSSLIALRQRTKTRFAIVDGKIEHWATDVVPLRSELAGAAIVVFTSGSTGQPKGVIVGHQGLCFKLGVLSKLLMFEAADVIVVPLQMTFIFGIWVTLLGILAGSRVVLVSKFTAETALQLLQSATVLPAVPTMLRALSSQKRIEAPFLQKILSGGEPFGVSLATTLRARFPMADVYDLFGLTETGSCDFCLRPEAQPQGFGTIGLPTDGVEFRIVPVAGQTVAGAGELQIRTPARMLGYLDEPEMTANAFEGSYFRTGDLARLREDGFVELVGRSKDIISRGGNKIAPLEIDNLFAQHPQVILVMSVGIADERLGEALHVLIVKAEGSDATDEEAIRDWAHGRIEKFKLPDGIHFCDALPVGSTGKADRKAAAKFLAEKMRSGT
jgi:long-chain acyl-CoA synthetase